MWCLALAVLEIHTTADQMMPQGIQRMDRFMRLLIGGPSTNIYIFTVLGMSILVAPYQVMWLLPYVIPMVMENAPALMLISMVTENVPAVCMSTVMVIVFA